MSALRAAFFILLATGPAAAQVTPEQVWTSWQGLGQGAGYQITATDQRRDGASLVLEGVAAMASAPRGTMRAAIGQVVMRDLGDGTVEVTMPPAFDMVISASAPGRDPVDLTVSMEQDGYVAIVSGTPDAPRYAVSAGALTIGIKGPVNGDADVAMDAVLSLTGIRGATAIAQGAPMGVVYDLAVDAMNLAVATASPDGGPGAALSLTARTLTSRFNGTLPPGLFPGMAPAEALAAGLRGSGGYEAGAIEFGLDMAGLGGTTKVAGSTTGGSVKFGLDAAGLTYRTGLTGLAVSASGGMIPVPSLDLALEEYSLGLTMPLVRTETPADIALMLRLVGLSVPEATWAMIDPDGTLPRDPASVELDARGKATLLQDLGAAPPGGVMAIPGQIDSVSVDALAVSLAGATLSGTGAFALDNADRMTFPGFPRPTGSADLTLTGGNALLDRLTALGIVPQGQLIAARMGMLMFMQPGAGPDTLTSRLEITPDAQILANGQRIR